jgi:peptidoglycan/xylan/chitin deacetylase (PgdA/CDA1 family)
MIGGVARRIMAAGCRLPGGMRSAKRLRSRSLAIVMYHGVTDRPLPLENWCQLPADWFEAHVAYLASEYRVLPLAEVVARLRQGAALPERSACITFDDGLRNVATTAFPILRRHQLPSTIFLVPGQMATGRALWLDQLYHAVATTDRPTLRLAGYTLPLTTRAQRQAALNHVVGGLKRLATREAEPEVARLLDDLGAEPPGPDSPLTLMDWSEVERLAATGLVDFGSHTQTHPILSRCHPSRLRDELIGSRDALRGRLGRADLFAYPNGTRADFNGETRRAVVEAGYLCSLTTLPRLTPPGCDPYELPRVNVGSDTTPAAFEVRMLGL